MSEQPQLRPTTTPVGGGGSARGAAVILLVLLVGLAWMGLSGHGDPATEPAASLPPVPTQAAEATGTPTPAAVPSRAPRPTPEARLADDPYSLILAGDDAYAVLAHFGGRHYLIFLYEHQTGHLSGRARMPFPRDAAEGEVEFLHLWTRQPPTSLSVIGTWPVHLDPLIPETTRSGRVLEVSQIADPTAVEQSRLVRRGYELVIRAESRSRFALLVVDVLIGSVDEGLNLWGCNSNGPLWGPRHDC